MEILIDIDENLYTRLFDNGIDNYDDAVDMAKTIRKGTPLPKGHGDLIDRSKICKAIPAEEDNCTGMGMTYDEMDAYNDGIDIMYSRIQNAPTIIEGSDSE